MKLSARLSSVLVMVVIALASAARAAEAKSPQDDHFFPIMAWNHAPSDPAALAKMRDCGITVAGFTSVKDLDLVHAAGMRAIVHDPRVGDYDWTNVDAATARKNVESLIGEVGQHPAVFGYYLRDEPQATFFEGLEKVAAVVREKAPGKWPYINLFPNYAQSATQLRTSTYEEYLERFVATCKPPILSYDHYALLDDGTLGPAYWKNLEQMRGAARKAGVPFWNIVLSVAHFSFREVSAADLRFQAYSTLAYGGRGLSYFTYFAPNIGNFRAAPIDHFGQPTPTWHAMRNVNHQILKLAPTMLKLTSDDVYHFGTIPDGGHGPGGKSLMTAINGDAMAGEFTHADDGSRWVMVVNRDVNKSFPCQPTWRTMPKRVQKLSPYDGQLAGFDGEQIWVAPGAGVLLKVE